MKIEFKGFEFKGFLNTVFGSWVKVFVSAMLLQIMNSLMEGHPLFTFDWPMWQKVISAGVVAILPVMINYLNPNDPRYGSKKTINLEPTDETKS